MRIAHLFCAAAAAPMLMAAAGPLRLQPSSRWEVNYAENSCRLTRMFGQGNDAVLLGFESEAPGHTDMMAVGKPLATISQDVPARFLPTQAKPIKGLPTQSATGPAALWSRVYLLPDDLFAELKERNEARRAGRGVRPPPLDLAEEAQTRARHLEFARQTTAVEFMVRGGRPVILETGSLGDAMKAFDKCSRDSLHDWGINPDVEDKIVRPAWSPNVYRWFTAEDYPRDMARRGEQSDVKVRLLVDATGAVTKCTSLSHFKEKSFETIVCDKFMRRAHFEPAELADGTKVPSYYINNVIFRMAN